MALNLNVRVAECLKANADQRFKARDIAAWILANYPSECAQKLENSSVLHTEGQLLQQLVAEIGANRPLIEAKWKQVKTTAERPRHYYWSTTTDEAEVATAEGAVQAAEPAITAQREHDLYPLLTTFLWAQWGLYSKRIDEKTASNKHGPQGNRWLFPDLVAMEDLTKDLLPEVRALADASGSKRVRLWAFEVKLLLNRSNVREAFFQTVSNSSWANFGYLVATEITTEAERELQMLSALHGVGVVRLDKENPSESEVLIPAKARAEIDWANANRLAENKDFQRVVKVVRQFHQTGDPHEKDWDKP